MALKYEEVKKDRQLSKIHFFFTHFALIILKKRQLTI